MPSSAPIATSRVRAWALSLLLLAIPNTSPALTFGEGPAPRQSVGDPGVCSLLFPLSRQFPASTWDATGHRMYVFGGLVRTGPVTTLNDAWVFRPTGSPAWSAIEPAGAKPATRYGHSMIFDPPRNRLLVFGGSDGTSYFNDVWELSLSGTPTWTQLTPTGTAPLGRLAHTAIYDPLRDRMVVFGGTISTFPRRDVWALSLGSTPTWTQITPGSGIMPRVRSEHAAVYDPVGDRMVICAGWDISTTTYLNDCWALALAPGGTWSAISPSGTRPSARRGLSAVYIPASRHMIVHGGVTSTTTVSDTWAFALGDTTAWELVNTVGLAPIPRGNHGAVFDTDASTMFVYGLNTSEPGTVRALTLGSAATWSHAPTATPRGRFRPSAVFDVTGDRLLVFGGGAFGEEFNDLWQVTLTSAGGWAPVAAQGTPPSARVHHTATLDLARNRMLILGGEATGSGNNELWALGLSEPPGWTQLFPLGTPPGARSKHSAILDPTRDRMLVFGGTPTDDGVWALSLAGAPAWELLTTVGAPPTARAGHTAILDPIRDRMLVFGGSASDNGVWALSLPPPMTWTLLSTSGTAPAPLSFHTAHHDPIRDRMLVFGPGTPGEIWELSLGGTPTWTKLLPGGAKVPSRTEHASAYDPWRDRVVVLAGFGLGVLTDDVWAYVSTTVVGVDPETGPGEKASTGVTVHPNPTMREARIHFSLAAGGMTRINVFDTNGRCIRTLSNGALRAGANSVTWDGRSDAGTRVPAGIYFARVDGPGLQANLRMVRLR